MKFSRKESRISGAPSKSDEFLLNPQIRTFSGTVPGTSRNTDREYQEPTWHRSQNDPHPKVGSSVHKLRNSIDSDPDQASHSENSVLGVPKDVTSKIIELCK